MTATTPQVRHPLDQLSGEEIARTRQVLVEAGRVGETTRFPSVLLLDPPKAEVRAWSDGQPFSRRVVAVVLDIATGAAAEAFVDLVAGELTEWRELGAEQGQPAVLFEEYDRSADLVRADPRWQAALRRRGVEDLSLAFVGPLSPGHFDYPDEKGRRVLRALTFLRDHVDDSPWAHPVEGLLAKVDLITGEVISVDDVGDVPVPAEHGNFDAAHVGTARTTLKPIEITQPEGVSFTVDGGEVSWEGWRFRVGFNAREGLTLHRVEFAENGGEYRPIANRASMAEMVVPYGDPAPWRYWISYFDAGEYLLGKNANTLKLGCDCLGVIHYFDAVVADDNCNPVTIPQAICMHEEDYGILWKHTNILTGAVEVRRSRRLVVSFFSTIGNYDYGFFWYFYLDGTIQLEAKATGVVFCGSAEPGTTSPYAAEIAPGLMAPVHQHLFCARLDMEVGGERNTVDEVDVVGIPTGPQNPHGNAFTTTTTPLASESQAQRVADATKGRSWIIRSADSTNRLGKPRAYQLMPHVGPTLLAQPDATVSARAAFATKHLWVTKHTDEQRYPAGDFPNQHPGGAGLPEWTKADRDLVDEDVVLWHVFGPTHVPRPEDWPVMPVDYSGFTLRPHGFCDRNPALDLPDGAKGCAHCPPGQCGCGH
ncbi:primary-amine oxidase [Actinokineospora auranticolor]|uniref:Amine oxidase n=1 Tax=Actinokineospora auranticolor TaxID=155976 RepID=A0A2S6GMI5_9PSEU|nr:primary-amine oxidase [Actinokineospora auranticolor]PPK66452.1 primary-amine oxidase [Actinokineospora auranticolor]